MFNLPTHSSFLLPLLLTSVSAQITSTVLAQASTTVVASTVTSYVLAPTTPASPQYTDDLTFRTSILNSTNLYRYQHNATFLSWNASLAAYAANYASQCIWAHSHGPYGENLARGYPDVVSSVDVWGNERAQYTFSPPNAVTGFSEATGHFTQLVWKDTTTVGCGVYNCSGTNGIGGWMLVCEYWPAGNIMGVGNSLNTYFMQNVQSQILQGTQGFNEYSATVAASGAPSATATGSVARTGTATPSAAAAPVPLLAVEGSGVLWRVFAVVVGVLELGPYL